MAEKLEVTAGWWWRFDRYEIRDGYIRPGSGATLERYDPWVRYRGGRTGRKEQETPYTSLLTLLNDITPEQTTPVASKAAPEQLTLTSADEAKLLAWCQEYGLLGVLPHRVQTVTLAPRWEPASQLGGYEGLSPRLRRYMRTNLGWMLLTEGQTVKGEFFLIEEPALRDQLVAEEQIPKHWPAPGVFLQTLGKSRWDQESLSTTWGQFFPAVPTEERETYVYPPPLTEEFWHLYAEPLSEFMHGAIVLHDALREIAQKEPIEALARGINTLQALVVPVSPILSLLKKGSFGQKWFSTSLLASFAMMACQDLTTHRRMLSCQACGAIFVSRAYQVKYCSETCRHRDQKRHQRARKKESVRQQKGAPRKELKR